MDDVLTKSYPNHTASSLSNRFQTHFSTNPSDARSLFVGVTLTAWDIVVLLWDLNDIPSLIALFRTQKCLQTDQLFQLFSSLRLDHMSSCSRKAFLGVSSFFWDFIYSLSLVPAPTPSSQAITINISAPIYF